ncbi:MAG: NAD(P)-binding domain-containing protein [Bacteroidales bacterium]|nr:NAD(P)-binding domain-containing protein [Bacteroidales bacterium]
MKIVAVESIGMSPEQVASFEKEFAEKGHTFICYPDRNENPEALAERMREADIAIISNIKLERKVLEQCPHLKMLSVAFTGLDHIDLEYCEQKGIEVVNAAGYATQGVAELAVGLMLDVYRKISELNTSTQKGGTRNGFLGRQLGGKTVGVVGTGAIGIRTAELLQHFGCKVIAWSRTVKQEVAEKLNIQYVSLDELMRTSDIISLHVPLTKDTRLLIDAQKLSLCKPSAIIINTARGGVMDNVALADKLKKGELAGAGIDVFEKEPPLEENYALFTAPNCVLTPHIGYATQEAFSERIDLVISHIWDYLNK